MSELSTLNILARIKEDEDGLVFNVRFQVVPREGEFIDLFSHRDQKGRKYVVITVVHFVRDIDVENISTHEGEHDIIVYVKPIATGLPT